MKHFIRQNRLNGFPRLAFIGCGAIVEHFHIPAIQKLKLKPSIFIDPDLDRAESMSKYFAGKVSSDYKEMMDEFDAAIVAVPHNLHSTICTDLLRNKKHVLVEKPMATTIAECNEMNMAAKENNATLAVGLFRRFLHSAQWVRTFIRSGRLGEVEHFVFREGSVYSWPVTTDSFWKKEKAGGGVLIDTGSHALDLLIWWVGGFESVDYEDDSYGGVEADCILNLKLKSGAEGTVELSRTRNLGSHATITGSKGSLQVDLCTNKIKSDPLELTEMSFNGFKGTKFPKQSLGSLFTDQMRNWLEAIIAGKKPYVNGWEGAKAIALINICYQNRKLWSLPWVEVYNS